MTHILSTTTNGYGNITIYTTTLGTFHVTRRDYLDYYGNPIYIIAPIGYVKELPKVEGFRRSHIKQWYTTQSYNIEQDFIHFLDKLSEQLDKGHKLFHNS